MKFIRDIMTGIDGKTFDVARVCLIPAALTFLGLAGYAVHKGQAWNPVEFGTGFGVLLAGACGGIKLKEKTEPAVGATPSVQ